MKLKLADVARMIGGDIVAPQGAEGIDIEGLARIEQAGPGQITFIGAPQYEKFLTTTQAAAVIVTADLAREEREPCATPRSALVRVEDPYRAFMKLMSAFDPNAAQVNAGIHPTAIVPASATVHPEASVGPYVVLGERVTIGAGTRICPNVVIGSDVTLGADCCIYSGVTVREGCQIGNRVIIHPGAAIGADGFGYLPTPEGRREKVPQVGRVRIEDDVEIGANTTIDRATVDETIIRRGAKIDNLVQIAHNVEVGEDSCLAALVGISGSTRIGARNLIGGQVGLAGHIETADEVMLVAQAGVMSSIEKPGVYSGAPATDRREFFQMEAALRRLPAALKKIRDLERRLAALEGGA